MTILPSELLQKGYVLLDKLEHNQLPAFLRQYLNKRTTSSIFFYGINMLQLIVAIVLFVVNFQERKLPIEEWILYYFIGFSVSFLFIPLHECIHLLAYRSQGATNTSLSANFKQFYFMALADDFVANKKEFSMIALAPFVSISILLICLMPLTSGGMVLSILGSFLGHTAMCSGDFALLSYFEYHKDKQVVTFDNVREKASYFFGK